MDRLKNAVKKPPRLLMRVNYSHAWPRARRDVEDERFTGKHSIAVYDESQELFDTGFSIEKKHKIQEYFDNSDPLESLHFLDTIPLVRLQTN